MEELKNNYRERVDFSKIKTAFPMPDLLAIQRDSYAEFLQMELLPEERKDIGLQAAFKDAFPVSDFKETTQLDFISYSIGVFISFRIRNSKIKRPLITNRKENFGY